MERNMSKNKITDITARKDDANFMAATFLGSKRSLKKVYGLKCHHLAILRYICDSIDKSKKKSKKLETRLYLSQIVKFTHASRSTVIRSIQHLIKKRLLKLSTKSTYTVGIILHMSVTVTLTKEVCHRDTYQRSVSQGHLSNFTNITKGGKSYPQVQNSSNRDPDNHAGLTSVEQQSTSYKPIELVKSNTEIANNAIRNMRTILGLSPDGRK